MDLVSEVKVQEGVPSAEYGRTSGGVISYITRSGSNDLHGNATGFLRNTVLDARPYNSATVPRDQQWEMALSVGGPVWIPQGLQRQGQDLLLLQLDDLPAASHRWSGNRYGPHGAGAHRQLLRLP